MLYLARAMVYLLTVIVNAAGATFTLSAEAQPPVGGTLLGSAPALVLPIRKLVIARGTGPTSVVLFTGYWTLTP